MSTTPRPWVTGHLTINDVLTGASESAAWGLFTPNEQEIATIHTGGDDARFVQRAVNAFDALLAVAKAADGLDTSYDATGDSQVALGHALADLDAAHPGWRDWQP